MDNLLSIQLTYIYRRIQFNEKDWNRVYSMIWLKRPKPMGLKTAWIEIIFFAYPECLPCKWYRKYFWNYLNFWCRLHALRYQYLSCFKLSATCEYTSIKSRQDICTWTSVLPDFKVGHSRLLNFVFFFTDTISYLKLDTFNITLTA